MFGGTDDPDEERLECMVKLLQTCGKKLDQTASTETARVRKALAFFSFFLAERVYTIDRFHPVPLQFHC